MQPLTQLGTWSGYAGEATIKLCCVLTILVTADVRQPIYGP